MSRLTGDPSQRKHLDGPLPRLVQQRQQAVVPRRRQEQKVGGGPPGARRPQRHGHQRLRV